MEVKLVDFSYPFLPFLQPGTWGGVHSYYSPSGSNKIKKKRNLKKIENSPDAKVCLG